MHPGQIPSQQGGDLAHTHPPPQSPQPPPGSRGDAIFPGSEDDGGEVESHWRRCIWRLLGTNSQRRFCPAPLILEWSASNQRIKLLRSIVWFLSDWIYPETERLWGKSLKDIRLHSQEVTRIHRSARLLYGHHRVASWILNPMDFLFQDYKWEEMGDFQENKVNLYSWILIWHIQHEIFKQNLNFDTRCVNWNYITQNHCQPTLGRRWLKQQKRIDRPLGLRSFWSSRDSGIAFASDTVLKELWLNHCFGNRFYFIFTNKF